MGRKKKIVEKKEQEVDTEMALGVATEKQSGIIMEVSMTKEQKEELDKIAKENSEAVEIESSLSAAEMGELEQKVESKEKVEEGFAAFTLSERIAQKGAVKAFAQELMKVVKVLDVREHSHVPIWQTMKRDEFRRLRDMIQSASM